MGQAAPVFDVSRERASSEVRDYLRELRPGLRMTQKELAQASDPLPTPISREFIANLETSGLPGTVRKFLSYAWLTGADLQLLAELTVAGSFEVAPGVSIDRLIKACREKVEAGEHREALALARSASRHTDGEEGDARERIASMLVVGSIAAKQGGLWRLQRELAEQAFCSDDRTRESAARALVLMASAVDALGRGRLAIELLEIIDISTLDADPLLAASYWGQKCLLYWSAEDFDDALDAADTSLDSLRVASDLAQIALMSGVKSHILLEAGDLERAEIAARQAVEHLERSGERGAIRRSVLCDAARVETLLEKLDDAQSKLDESRDLALEAGHELHLFEARVGLCRLAHRRGDVATRDRLIRLLRLSAPRVGSGSIRLRDYRRLLDEIHQGGGHQ